MAIKKGDFIELDFVGSIKETNQIFDVTDAARAKKEKIYNPRAHYGPKIICVGEQQLVRGIDTFLAGKELKQYTLEIPPEEGFGKKDARLMKLIPLSTFKKEKIQPFPGLQIQINGTFGVVRTVSGGRIIVDFNHPLAGRHLFYELTVKRIVHDSQEKLSSYLFNLFNQQVPCTLTGTKATITLDLPEQIQKFFIDHVKTIIPELKEIVFIAQKKAEEKPVQKTATQA